MADRNATSQPVERAPRQTESREAQIRPTSWAPPNLLPTPEPQDGFSFRWVRVSTLGQADATNVSSKFREGWTPVRADDHPELQLMTDPNSRFKGNVEVGGLLLCKIPAEVALQRDRYYSEMASRQMDSVDNNFMRENDPRMPLLKPERTTRVTFGSGK
jgi:hypothetical protein